MRIESYHTYLSTNQKNRLMADMYEQGDYVKVEFPDETAGIAEWMWMLPLRRARGSLSSARLSSLKSFGSTNSGLRSRLGASGRALIFVPCSSGLDTRTWRARCVSSVTALLKSIMVASTSALGHRSVHGMADLENHIDRILGESKECLMHGSSYTRLRSLKRIWTLFLDEYRKRAKLQGNAQCT